MKNKGGRPTKYKPEYCQEIVDYFSIEPFEDRVTERKTEHFKDGGEKSSFEKIQQVAIPLRFISGFAREIGVTHETIGAWSDTHPEFSEALKKAKDLQREHLITCGLKGLFNPSFAIFSAKNMIGWRDVKELTGKDGGPLVEPKIQIVFVDRKNKEVIHNGNGATNGNGRIPEESGARPSLEG